MRIFPSILAATSLLGLTNAIPEPTPKKLNAWDSNGWTPAPTGIADGSLAGFKHPSLLKRQAGSDDLSVCGYLDGQADEALTCSAGRWCGYDTVDAWFGCCLTTTVIGTRTRPAGCPVVTDCVDSALVAECTGACALDNGIRKCTDAASPYCGILTFGDAPMTNYICGTAAATTYELFLSPTGAEGTGTFKTPTGSFTATGTAVGGGSGTFNLGSTSTAITKGNLQTLSDDSSATTATATTASVKVVTVVSTTGAAQSSAFAAPIGVPGAIEVLGAAVMAVFGLF